MSDEQQNHSGRVVVGVSPTSGSPAALRWGAAEAARLGAPLVALSAWRPPRAPIAPAVPVPTPAADEGGARRRWLAPGAEAASEAVPAAPRVKLGGTLFERMSNAARGAAKEDGEAAPQDPLDIPRFLHRQNNQ